MSTGRKGHDGNQRGFAKWTPLLLGATIVATIVATIGATKGVTIDHSIVATIGFCNVATIAVGGNHRQP